MKASVKVMRSYDYNHFEVSLSSEEVSSLEEVDDLRKSAARLVDKAVIQYQTSKNHALRIPDQELSRQAKIITENHPKSEWTEEQKAIIKKHEDDMYWSNRIFDYEDEWDVDN